MGGRSAISASIFDADVSFRLVCCRGIKATNYKGMKMTPRVKALGRTKSAITLPQQYRYAVVNEISSNEIEEAIAIKISSQDGVRTAAHTKVLGYTKGATALP